MCARPRPGAAMPMALRNPCDTASAWPWRAITWTIDNGWRTASTVPGCGRLAPKRPWRAMPASGETREAPDSGDSATGTALAMELLVLFVVMDGRAHFSVGVNVAQAIPDLQDLAIPVATALEEAKADPAF